jgi:hypothetical protein
MTTDKICERYADKNIKIKLRMEDDMIFIEGKAEALEFLGNLLLAQANADTKDCGFHVSPFGARKTFFSSDSTQGIYIHRIPCEHKKS